MSWRGRVVPPFRWVAATVAALVTAGVVLETAFVLARPGQLAAHRYVSFLYLVPSTVTLAVVAVAVLKARSRHPVGRLFAFLAVVGGSGAFANGYTTWDLPAEAWVAWLDGVLSAPAFGVLAVALLLFPTGRVPSSRWHWLLRAEQAQVVAAAGLAALAHRTAPIYPNEGPTHDHPLAVGGRALADAADLVAELGIVMLLASAVSLVLRWRRSVGDERLQVRWIGAAALVFAVTSAIAPATLMLGIDTSSGTPVEFLVGDAIFHLALVLVPAAMGVAIVRHRLYDIDRLITRTIVYGLLAFVLGTAYVGAVVAVGEIVTGDASSTLVAVVFTAVSALVFHPLRARLQVHVDRLIYGQRAAPYDVMSALARELEATVEPAEVLGRIASTVQSAIAADVAVVSVVLAGRETASASAGAAPHDRAFDVVVPIVDGDETVGEIAVVGGADRRGDHQVLRRIAGLSTPALRNLRLLAELDALYELILDQNHGIAMSRTRLINAAAREREHLRRLVSRRIDPYMSAVRDGLRALRETMGDRPDEAAELCHEMVGVGTRLVEEIRALSRGVLPPVLADHGLAAALRATLRRIDLDAVLDTPASLVDARFETTVEVTAYLSCRAALDAAVASAATGVEVALEARDDDLRFTVTHDALRAGPGHEIGELQLERDLIETLQGDLLVRQVGELTVVTGRIPLEIAQPTSLRKVSTA